jgi:hypothetical protein
MVNESNFDNEERMVWYPNYLLTNNIEDPKTKFCIYISNLFEKKPTYFIRPNWVFCALGSVHHSERWRRRLTLNIRVQKCSSWSLKKANKFFKTKSTKQHTEHEIVLILHQLLNANLEIYLYHQN